MTGHTHEISRKTLSPLRILIVAACVLTYQCNISLAAASQIASTPKRISYFPADDNLQRLTRKAESGDASAQSMLGLLYAKGLSVPRDLKKAVSLYEKASARGSATAQFRLAVLYENGNGVAKDLNKAVELYEKSAAGGYAIAQCYLGFLYQNGQGVVQDLAKAALWYQKAVNQEYPAAQTALAELYENGTGVPKNWQKATQLYQAAADHGDKTAMQALVSLQSKTARVAKAESLRKDEQDGAFEEAMAYALKKSPTATDRDQAIKKLTQSSTDGCAESVAILALLARYGTWAPAVARDESAAQELAAIALADGLEQRAEDGRANAQVLLALLYQNGLGVETDRNMARDLGLRAAESGTAIAQYAQLQELLMRPVVEATPSQIHPDLQEALASANKAGKQLIVDFFGAWCPWCVKMDETLHDSDIESLLNASFWYYKLDVGQFDQHTDCIKKYDVHGIPHIIVFNSDGSPKATSHGYSDVATFKEFLNAQK